mmetsp:Transcript_35626/g.82765  ORF Transcript_35626/g.82765 Transcript_35626/m.82765 type:complete len:298 (+) Transcript_35626:31-924(+)
MAAAASAAVRAAAARSARLRPAGSALSRCWGGRRFIISASGDESSIFPNAWTQPEALYEYAQSQGKGKDEDDAFMKDFGQRNKEWREETLRSDPEMFARMGGGQAPKYLWIGCCDSRVAAENLVKGQPGEIFVHRNIANLVIASDTNLRAVLHFAVDYLQIEHLIVCGHYDCGGVRAAMAKRDHNSPVENWLTHIRDVYRMHHDELDAIIDDSERHKKLVELNVMEQCLNLFKTAEVQRRRCYTAQRPERYRCAFPRIHGLVFSPNDGILRNIPVDWRSYLNEFKHVFQMYDLKSFQ